MTAQWMWQTSVVQRGPTSWRSNECVPAIGCCVDLVERICASALLAFATVDGSELPLPSSIASLALTGVNFTELKSKSWGLAAPAGFQEFRAKQLNWLSKRLRDALHAVRRLGLLDPKAESSDTRRPLASTPWGLVLFERVAILYLGILCVTPLSQLTSWDLEKLVVRPLRLLSHQCSSPHWLQQTARFNRFGADVTECLTAYDANRAKLPSALYKLLRTRCVRVRESPTLLVPSS